jgi:hypothetical protein
MAGEQNDRDILVVHALAHAAGEIVDRFEDCDATGSFIDQRGSRDIGVQARLAGGDLLSVAKRLCDAARIIRGKMEAELIHADGEHVQHCAGRLYAARGRLHR